MELDTFVKCSCGKKKKIEWLNKEKYRSGESSFCVGITKCPRCEIVQQHYSGDLEDIQRFIKNINNL